MSWLSNIVKQAAPIVAAVSPDPITKGVATALSVQYANQDINYQQKLAEQQAAQRRKKMAEIFQGQGLSSIQPNVQAQGTQNAGNRGFFGGVGDFFGNIGEGISTGFGTALGNLFGGNRPRGVGQQPAVTTVTNVGAQESQGSGSIQAGFGSLLPSVIGAARGLIKSPIGSLVTGTGIGTAISMIGADGKPMRVTRKMKAQARSLLNMTGGNLAMTANFLNISEDQLVFILLKRFRNDGPVVTKAALRKTKSTIRKMKNMCDMYDDLRPAARRRTPMKRASRTTTLIKN
jgi:hypothetical protein